MVTLPTGLTGEHRTQFEGYRAWAGNDSALTHPSAFPQLPVGAAETARRWRVGGNPRVGNPTRPLLAAKGRRCFAP